ncbi:protein FAM161B [Oryzias latipes]|uniref:FAM161 centrosomal protein B n=1 Tax=Oryzias latipes TaxID=8090 RepID=A0A3B3HHI5_ORYLA|nr:protein FAM161B [Oryzias latipes]
MMGDMSKLDTLLQDGLQSELTLQYNIKALRKTLRQQLQETKMRQTEELEKRVQQNSLLSAEIEKMSDDKEELNKQKCMNIRRSISMSDLTTRKENSNLNQRPTASSSAWGPSTNWRHCSVGTHECERFASYKSTHQRRTEEEDAECLKKFRALPVPKHVMKPIYQDMLELKEKERKQSCEHRKQFLLSIQKPFSFHERDKTKREKLVTTVNQVSHDPKTDCFRKNLSKPNSSMLKASQQGTLCHVGRPKLYTAERASRKKTEFLDVKPSFQPKILHQVPNFSKLHKALMNESLRKIKSNEATKCQPFFLRTSSLPSRTRRKSLEPLQLPTMTNLSRSKSLGALTWMTANTLPIYISDAVRKRCTAIKKSMELRESNNQESLDWLRNYQKRSKALEKTVALRAKFLDPHSSLKEVHTENLQRHRQTDKQRMNNYMRDLKDIKARVKERPYLFEQVKQRNAKDCAEQTYRNKLRKVGLTEVFVDETGDTSRSDDDTKTSINSVKSESSHIREENADDWEKIEDVEKESVKSKREETP